MHELSIAINILEIAEEQCRRHNGEKVISVSLEIGKLSGVMLEALELALDSAKQGSIAQDAIFEILNIDGTAECIECGTQFNTVEYINRCPSCSSFKTQILKGKELKVISLQIE